MGTRTRLWAACLLAGALAVPVGVAAEEAVDKAEAHQARHDDRARERLMLDCRAFGRQDHDAVGCHWSPSRSRDFAGYRLLRASRGEQPTTVFTTDRRDETKARDEHAPAGRDHLYVVQAVDAAGEVIAQSNPVRVHDGTRPERPTPGLALPGVAGL